MFENTDPREILRGHRAEDEDEEALEEVEEREEEADPELVERAEAVLDVIDPYGAVGPVKEPDDDETPLQRQQRLIDRRANEERRRAKAELLAEVLADFFEACDRRPHEEGEHE